MVAVVQLVFYFKRGWDKPNQIKMKQAEGEPKLVFLGLFRTVQGIERPAIPAAANTLASEAGVTNHWIVTGSNQLWETDVKYSRIEGEGMQISTP